MSIKYVKDIILNLKSDEIKHSKNNEKSCSCSVSYDQYLDKDLEELANADMSSVRAELGSYGRDADKMLERLFVDLDPDVIRLIANSEKNKNIRPNYFLESFSVIQEAVLESLYTTKKRFFWQREPAFSAVAGVLLFVMSVFLAGNLWHWNNGGSGGSLQEEVVATKGAQNGSPPTKKDLANPVTIVKANYKTEIKNHKFNKDSVTATTQISEIINNFSLSNKEDLSRRAYDYLMGGGKLEPTEEMNLFLKKLTENNLFNEAKLIKAAIYDNRKFCSDSGFYSHIIEKGETLSSISKRCGFNYSDFNEAQDIPMLHESDVVHFNFDQENTLTKVTIYKNNDFHILDFDQGKFLKKEILGKENSISVEIDLNNHPNIYASLKNNDELKNKGDLWKKISDSLDKGHAPMLIQENQSNNIKYYVNIKYRHNNITNHYEVIGTSLFVDRYGS